MPKFLTQVKREMKRQEVSAYKLAKLTGLGQSYVYRIVGGKSTPSIDCAAKIADALGIKMILTNKK